MHILIMYTDLAAYNNCFNITQLNQIIPTIVFVLEFPCAFYLFYEITTKIHIYSHFHLHSIQRIYRLCCRHIKIYVPI